MLSKTFSEVMCVTFALLIMAFQLVPAIVAALYVWYSYGVLDLAETHKLYCKMDMQMT